MRRLSDEEALQLGNEIAELTQTEAELEEWDNAKLISLGRVAYRLCLPLVVGNIRKPSEAMVDAGWVAGLNQNSPNAMKDAWESMVSVLLEEVG